MQEPPLISRRDQQLLLAQRRRATRGWHCAVLTRGCRDPLGSLASSKPISAVEFGLAESPLSNSLVVCASQAVVTVGGVCVGATMSAYLERKDLWVAGPAAGAGVYKRRRELTEEQRAEVCCNDVVVHMCVD